MLDEDCRPMPFKQSWLSDEAALSGPIINTPLQRGVGGWCYSETVSTVFIKLESRHPETEASCRRQYGER
jgi:hypothetical protein